MSALPRKFYPGFPNGIPYYELPGYVKGSPPLYGVDFFSIDDNALVARHIETDILYYFYFLTDIPAPKADWEIRGRYFVDGEFDVNLVPLAWYDVLGEMVFAFPEYIYTKIEEKYNVTRKEIMAIAAKIELAALAVLVGELAGGLAGIASLVAWIGGKIAALWAATEGIRKTISEKIAAAKKLYTAFAKKIHLDELLVIERVLDLTWKQYAKKKTEFLARIGAISKELFGDVHVVNQWINLAGMAFKDLALLEGYTWAEQDMRWLVRSADFLVDVEDRLETYARHPENLWLDIETELVRPIYEARAARMTKSEAARQDLVTGAGMLQKGYQSVDRRLRQYQLALPDNIKKGLGPGLTKLRKDLKEFYSDDLRGVINGIKYAAGISSARIKSMKTAQQKIAKAEARNTKLLTKPKELTTAEKVDQREIFSSIESDIADRFNAFAWKVLAAENPKWGDTYKKIWEGK